MKYWRILLLIITTSRLIVIQPTDKCYRSWPSWRFFWGCSVLMQSCFRSRIWRLEFNVQVWLCFSVWYLAQERDLSAIYLWIQPSAKIFRHFSEVIKWDKFFPCYFAKPVWLNSVSFDLPLSVLTEKLDLGLYLGYSYSPAHSCCFVMPFQNR